MIEKLQPIENYSIRKKNGKIKFIRIKRSIVVLIIRLNIGTRLGSVSTPTIINETTTTITTRQRLKRPRLEIDDDDVVITNGNGH